MTEQRSNEPVESQYRALLRRILAEGEWIETPQGPRALTLMQQTLRYPLHKGYPVIPDRDISGFWNRAIGELCAFINGATTERQLRDFGCNWWGAWTTEQKTGSRGLPAGDLGPGSYGGAFHDFPGQSGPFDQFAALMEQIKFRPELRTHFITPWIPDLLSRAPGRVPKATIAPCHGWAHFRVIAGRLDLHLFQRSGDVPIGVPSNLVQYSALQLMVSHLTGLPVGNYYHTISDAHIYEDQLEQAELLSEREPLPLGKIVLTEEGRRVNDIHDFRRHHFELVDYRAHPPIVGIPVAS